MTILLIEDDRLFSETIVHSIVGHDIHVVSTVAAARRWLSKNQAKLILIDLNLPDSSGLDTLKAIKCCAPKVVLTSTLDITNQAAALGAVDYICKAHGVDQLLERIAFNIAKYAQVVKKNRFDPASFQQIKACLSSV